MTANLTSDVVDFFTADEAKTAAWVQAQDRVSLEKAFSYFADPAPALAKIQETGDKTLVSWFFETITKNRKGQQLWTSRNPLIDAINNQNLELVRYLTTCRISARILAHVLGLRLWHRRLGPET